MNDYTLLQGDCIQVMRVPPMPRTLEEADELAKELGEIVEALQDMAVDGQMPRLQLWESERPVELPCFQTIRKRHGIEAWRELALLAGLEARPERKGSGEDMTPARRAQLERLQEERRSVQRERVASAQAKGRNGNVLPTREEIVRELQRQAMAGVMPTRGQFDESKPANWATAWAHMQRLNVKWEELRLEAGLKPNPRVAARIEA